MSEELYAEGSASAEPTQTAPVSPEPEFAIDANIEPERTPEPEPTVQEHLEAAEEHYAQAEAHEDAVNRLADPTQHISQSSLHGNHELRSLPKRGDAGQMWVQVSKE